MKAIKYILMALYLVGLLVLMHKDRGIEQGIFLSLFALNMIFPWLIYRRSSGRQLAFTALLFKLLMQIVNGIATVLIIGGSAFLIIFLGLLGPLLGGLFGMVVLWIWMLPSSMYSLTAQLRLKKSGLLPTWLFVILVVANFVLVLDLVSAAVTYVLARKFEGKVES